MRARTGRATIVAVLAIACTTELAAPGLAATTPPRRFPAAGELLRSVDVRAAPSPSASVVRRMLRFRADHQFQIVLALERRRAAGGEWWYRLSLPGPPNGARGWIPAAVVELRPVVNRIVVRLGARRLEVRRVRDGRVLLRAVAAVGAAGSETPRGRDFYVQSAFVPTDPLLRVVRARDERVRACHRLAHYGRRHPRHEPAVAPRAGGLARVRPRLERRRDAAPAAGAARDADRHRSLAGDLRTRGPEHAEQRAADRSTDRGRVAARREEHEATALG